MNFKEGYDRCETWHGRCVIMELFHLFGLSTQKEWTVSQTAAMFNCSMGLTSENLRLANAFHKHPELMSLPTRTEALKKLNRMNGHL